MFCKICSVDAWGGLKVSEARLYTVNMWLYLPPVAKYFGLLFI